MRAMSMSRYCWEPTRASLMVSKTSSNTSSGSSCKRAVSDWIRWSAARAISFLALAFETVPPLCPSTTVPKTRTALSTSNGSMS